MQHDCDVAVIGAGSAGLSAERAARKAGARTRLIDDRFAGTVCASVGCMPSKLLIAAAESAHRVRQAQVFGIRPGDVAVDGQAVMKRVQEQRDRFVAGVRSSFEDLPDGTCIKASARFTSQTQLALDNGDTVSARSIVIATGSRPVMPEPFSDLGELALTNRTLFEIEDLPGSLAVIGGGSIGLEIAQAMARLGVEVALFDRGDTLGPSEDSEVQAALAKVIGNELELHLGVEVTAQRVGAGVRIGWSGDSEGERTFDRALVATGRAPQLDGLDLQASGLELDSHGVPHFDRTTLQCADTPVFIAGDADADVPLLHEASNEGAIAGGNAAAYPTVTAAERTPPFSVSFTDPPLAVLGKPGSDASVVGRASYENQGRATVEARGQGLVCLFADTDGTLLGAELFAPGADHMAHLLMLAVMRGESASSLLDVPFYHPTLEEGLTSALREICSATSSPLPGDRDQGCPPGA